MALLEVAIDTDRDGLIALENGADRLEVCAALTEGGLTPEMAAFTRLRSSTRKPLFVMVRERGGSFVYSHHEKSAMTKTIALFREKGADGFVFGALLPDGDIDEPFAAEAVRAAEGLPCTFHRAFDALPDPMAGLETLVRLGIRRILTSGGAQTAEEGTDVLHRLVVRAGERLVVLPGGGVRESNAERILHDTGAREIHSSCRDDEGAIDAARVTLIAGIAHLL